VLSRNIGDPHNILHEILPHLDDESYQCLRFIDWYGDTVFNHLQMDQLIEELARVAEQSPPDARSLLDQVRRLAVRCKRGTHLYLWFVGD
jgi:hypothetical protein